VKVGAAAAGLALVVAAVLTVVAVRADAAEDARQEAAAHARAVAGAKVAQDEQDWLREQRSATAQAASAAQTVEREARVAAANAVVDGTTPVVAASAGKADPAALNAAVEGLRAAIGTGVYSTIDAASATVAAEQQRLSDAIAAYDAEQARLAAEQAAKKAAQKAPTSGGSSSYGKHGSNPWAEPATDNVVSGPIADVHCTDNGDGRYRTTFTYAGKQGFVVGSRDEYVHRAFRGTYTGSTPRVRPTEAYFYRFSNPEALSAACGF